MTTGRRFRAFLPSAYHNWCLYCGERAQHRDHFSPWSSTKVAWWVPACASCNHILGYTAHGTWGERLECVQDRLGATNSHLLGHDIERALDGTGGALRQALLRELCTQASVEVRLLWAGTMADLIGEITLDCFTLEARQTLSAAVHALARREGGARP